jgi:hypothetical protein
MGVEAGSPEEAIVKARQALTPLSPHHVGAMFRLHTGETWAALCGAYKADAGDSTQLAIARQSRRRRAANDGLTIEIA